MGAGTPISFSQESQNGLGVVASTMYGVYKNDAASWKGVGKNHNHKSETASILKQDWNTWKVKKKAYLIWQNPKISFF